MKFIIFISDIIRHGNFPRLDRFEFNSAYAKYLYLGRELTVGEFNEASSRIFSPDFNSQGFTLRPQIVGEEIDAKAAEEAAAAAEAKRIANEEAGKKWLAELAETERLAALDGQDPEALTDETPTAPDFYFEGRQIFQNGERIAGLFGEDAQLRVRAEHADLRPAIEAWLNSQPTQ